MHNIFWYCINMQAFALFHKIPIKHMKACGCKVVGRKNIRGNIQYNSGKN